MDIELPLPGDFYCYSQDPGLDGTGFIECDHDAEPEPILREFPIGFCGAAPGPSHKPRYRVKAPSRPIAEAAQPVAVTRGASL